MDNVNMEQAFAILAGFGFLLVLVVAAVVVAGHLIGKAAKRKDRSYAAFFILSLLLSPLVTALVVAAIPFREDDPRHPRNK